MQDIEEGGDSIARHLADFRLLNEGLVEEGGGVLLLAIVAGGVFTTLGLHLGGGAGNIEAHLDELVAAGAGLFALSAGAALASRARVVGVLRQRQFDGDLIAACEVRVGNLRIGNLKGGLVLDVEDELGL